MMEFSTLDLEDEQAWQTSRNRRVRWEKKEDLGTEGKLCEGRGA